MSETIKPIDEDLEKINMFDPELMACPHAFFKKLRDEAPVYPVSYTHLTLPTN